MEAFDYAFYPRSSKGFMMAVSGTYVRPVLRQQGATHPD